LSYEAPTKYKGTGTYGVLTDGEKTTFDEYTNLRGISDWPGFDDAQDSRRADSREWISTGRTTSSRWPTARWRARRPAGTPPTAASATTTCRG
jgi:hypothetical protein